MDGEIKRGAAVSHGPDFICIGAQKAGTSWLYWNLAFHPQCAMPPEKEFNYFYPVRSLLRRLILAKWQQAIEKSDPQFPYDWYRRYLFAPRSAETYHSLFSRAEGEVSGDISPGYATMRKRFIQIMANAAPHAKIIYLLRDPVDRAWSHFKMAHPEMLHSRVTDAQRLEKIQSMCLIHSCYSWVLGHWERYFPGPIKVWFFDRIVDEPGILFAEICDYLGIQPLTDFNHSKIYEKVYEGPPNPLPIDVRRYLSKVFRPELEALDRRFDNPYTKRWLVRNLEWAS